MESRRHINPIQEAGVPRNDSPSQRAACAMGRITRTVFVNP